MTIHTFPSVTTNNKVLEVTAMGGGVNLTVDHPSGSLGITISAESGWDLVELLDEWLGERPPKPTALDCFRALPVGAEFRLNGATGVRRIKVSLEHYVITHHGNGKPEFYRASEYLDQRDTLTEVA